MGQKSQLKPVGSQTAHLSVDMQRLFAAGSDWEVPAIHDILPVVIALTKSHPDRTIFTRFIPPLQLQDAEGAWQEYYRKWPDKLRANLDPERLELVPALAAFTNLATVWDKHVYSPWLDGGLHRELQRRRVTDLLVTGAETDICVMATVLGAIDLGYRVHVISDGVCSSAPPCHDAAIDILHDRFSLQVSAISSAQAREAWR